MRFSVLRRSIAAAALAALPLLVLACSDSNGPGETTVQVQDDTFNPATATVGAGATVTWNWTGTHPHNVTWVNQSGVSDSPTQTSGTFSRNFTNAGTFDYFCTIHGTATSGMRGSVAVQ